MSDNYDAIKNSQAFKNAQYPWEYGTYGEQGLLLAFPIAVAYVKNLKLERSNLKQTIEELAYARKMRDKYHEFCPSHDEWRCIVGILLVRKSSQINSIQQESIVD